MYHLMNTGNAIVAAQNFAQHAGSVLNILEGALRQYGVKHFTKGVSRGLVLTAISRFAKTVRVSCIMTLDWTQANSSKSLHPWHMHGLHGKGQQKGRVQDSWHCNLMSRTQHMRHVRRGQQSHQQQQQCLSRRRRRFRRREVHTTCRSSCQCMAMAHQWGQLTQCIQ